MKCEFCKSEMVWEGSIARGKMVCARCKDVVMDDAIVGGDWTVMFKLIIRHNDGGGVVKCLNCEEFIHVTKQNGRQICDFCGVDGVIDTSGLVVVMWP